MNFKNNGIYHLLILIVFFNSGFAFSEDEKLEYYLKDDNLEHAVAQMFIVGYPADIINYTSCSECDYLVNKLRVGGIIINQYNVPEKKLLTDDRDNAFNKVTNFIDDITIKSRANGRTRLQLDPIVMVDFENYRFSSIKYPLASIPSALSIATTGDTKNAYLAGKLAGYHLTQTGVDVILGPVLDKNTNMVQGQPNSTIRDRAFSDRKKIVYDFASEYIKGLSTSNIKIFAKHYPSYSAIDGNPHSVASSYVGSTDNLKEDLSLFKELEQVVDGFMTSHLNTGAASRYLPFTFSRHEVQESFRNKGGVNTQKLLITDDLSDMKPVRTYMENRKRDFSEVALDAFLAGHDFLLFSHFGSNENFNSINLTNAIKLIANEVRENKEYKLKLEKTLARIFRFKDGIHNKSNVVDFDYKAKDIFNNSDYEDADDFVKSTISKGIVAIKTLTPSLPNTRAQSIDMEYLLITKERYFSNFNRFNNMGDNYTLIHPPEFKEILEYQKFLENKLSRYDLVYIIVDDFDDANAIDGIRIYHPKLLKKLIIILHESPSMLSSSLITDAEYIIGNFSRNPVAYELDNNIIFNEITAKPIEYLPVSLNQKTFYNSEVMPRPLKNNMSGAADKTRIYDTVNERMLDEENIRLLEKIDSQGLDFEDRAVVISTNKILYSFIMLLMILFGYVVLKPVYLMQENEDLLGRIGNTWKAICSALRFPKIKLALLFFIFTCLLIYIFPNNSFLRTALEDGPRKALSNEFLDSQLFRTNTKQ
jgi:beta-N-acetylhexosaminidase